VETFVLNHPIYVVCLYITTVQLTASVNTPLLLSAWYRVIVYVMKNQRKKLFSSDIKRSDLHLSESQRVLVAEPVTPANAFTVRRVVILTVQVGTDTTFVPPGTFVPHCTRVWPRVVVLVSSAELLSEMPACQWITFRQQTVCCIVYILQIPLICRFWSRDFGVNRTLKLLKMWDANCLITQCMACEGSTRRVKQNNR